MLEREFLGWNQPFSTLAVAWLLERRDELPRTLLVVPTAQSGRRLREAMAEVAGTLLSPRIVTPGSLLQSRDAEAAADWIERVAWTEVLEAVTDWSAYDALFPEPPGGEGDWAVGLAQEMVRLRHALQENGLLLATAARKLSETVEAGRWDALGRLEDLVERKIRAWGHHSRSRILADGLTVPAGFSKIILAGVAEMPPLVERAILGWQGPVISLIGAPESEAGEFSSVGKPSSNWSQRPQPWPGGAVIVVADPRQQAVEALRVVREMESRSDDVALGSADAEVGDELARAFTRAGWLAYHPAADVVAGGLVRWFGVWRSWLSDPTLAVMADLLALPETGILVAGKRAQKAKHLAELRDRWMILRGEDLQRRYDAGIFRNDTERELTAELCAAVMALEKWRASFLSGNFPATITRLLEILGKTGAATHDTAEAMADWIAAAAPLIERVKRGAGFWIDLMVSDQPVAPPTPPEGRVIDVQGWLEIFHEPGNHLVLCGMNDGKVPARGGGEPWLSEASRERLGLIRDADRAARDAYQFMAMLEARRDGGRVDVICGKSGAGGESLLPSRLLLAADRTVLPERVKLLFKDVEPPEAGMRWHADWQWKPRAATPPHRLSVTSLASYLACPFRYYLKHVLKMQSPEPTRSEWNARDFGNVAHLVLERWGRDVEARCLSKPEALHAWFSAELDRVVAEWFGKRVPLAVRIQTESIRQRLLWLANAQSISFKEGWEIIDVERKIELPAGEAIIVAQIDRIDRHRETGALRVLDYKTGKIETPEKAHRKKLGATAVLPAHLSEDGPAIYQSEDQGKTARFLWLNLQLPLYASALVQEGSPLPTPCYFALGNTEAEVEIRPWSEFDEHDLAAAQACASWVAEQIAAGIFQPPAKKVTYDDFAILAAGREFGEMFARS